MKFKLFFGYNPSLGSSLAHIKKYFDSFITYYKLCRFRQGFQRVFRFFCPCCEGCTSFYASNTTRGGAGGLDDHSQAPQTGNRYINSCQNAKHNKGLDESRLVIKSAFADQGPTMKRFRPRAQGRAYRILKVTTHITSSVAV